LDLNTEGFEFIGFDIPVYASLIMKQHINLILDNYLTILSGVLHFSCIRGQISFPVVIIHVHI